jgi:hypothetical protein
VSDSGNFVRRLRRLAQMDPYELVARSKQELGKRIDGRSGVLGETSALACAAHCHNSWPISGLLIRQPDQKQPIKDSGALGGQLVYLI